MKVLTLRSALLVAVAAIAVFALAACGGDDDDGGSTATPDTKETATQPANGGSGGSQDIEVDLTDNKFTPAEITVPVGAEIEFKVVNKGTAIHNMHILSKDGEGQDYSSEMIMNPGDESEFKVTFTKTGTYDFQCDYHLPDMVGKITVQ